MSTAFAEYKRDGYTFQKSEKTHGHWMMFIPEPWGGAWMPAPRAALERHGIPFTEDEVHPEMRTL